MRFKIMMLISCSSRASVHVNVAIHISFHIPHASAAGGCHLYLLIKDVFHLPASHLLSIRMIIFMARPTRSAHFCYTHCSTSSTSSVEHQCICSYAVKWRGWWERHTPLTNSSHPNSPYVPCTLTRAQIIRRLTGFNWRLTRPKHTCTIDPLNETVH